MPTEEKMSPPEPMAPMSVTVIGGTGDGGTGVPKGTIATTPSNLPNIVVNVVSPLMALAIRFGNVFVTSLVGLVTVAMTTEKGHAALMGPGDFSDLIYNTALLSLAPAGIDFLKNLVTIFGRLENKYPILTGNV